MNNEPHKAHRRAFGRDTVHSGAWIIGVELGDEEWAAYKRGDIDAFSIGATGYRSGVDPSQMPHVEFVDLKADES